MNKEYTILIDKQKSLLNKDLSIYKSDRGIDIYLKLLDNPYVDLSKNKYILSDVVLVDPLGKQIISDIMPINYNKVLFRISNKIINQIDLTGIYHVHIRLYDDKGGKLKLPSFIMQVIESNIDDNVMASSVLNTSSIDSSIIVQYGSDLPTYNIDGSYNRTVWLAGDVITDSKMNKIEQVISEVIDDKFVIKNKLAELDNEKGYDIRKGTEDNPIIISNLNKGSYLLIGYVKDFESSVTTKLTEGKNYLFVTKNDEVATYIRRCFEGEDSFTEYKYDKVSNLISLENTDAIDSEARSQIIELTKQIAELTKQLQSQNTSDLEILSFKTTLSKTVYEKGVDTISNVPFTWSLSKTPTSLSISNIGNIDVTKTSAVYDGTIDSTTTFELVAKDDSVTKNASITLSFVHPYYYGTFDNDLLISTIKTQNKLIQEKSNKSVTMSYTDKKIFFAYPNEYGDLKEVRDNNGFNYISDFIKETMTIDSILYNVYTLNEKATVSNITYSFNF